MPGSSGAGRRGFVGRSVRCGRLARLRAAGLDGGWLDRRPDAALGKLIRVEKAGVKSQEEPFVVGRRSGRRSVRGSKVPLQLPGPPIKAVQARSVVHDDGGAIDRRGGQRAIREPHCSAPLRASVQGIQRHQQSAPRLHQDLIVEDLHAEQSVAAAVGRNVGAPGRFEVQALERLIRQRQWMGIEPGKAFLPSRHSCRDQDC